MLLAGALLVACLCLVQQASANPLQGGSSYNIDMVNWLAGKECGQDEYLAEGKLPSCEPTCDNKKPICQKVFYVMDTALCFCKAPLVRDTKSNKCVPVEQCPNN